MRYLSYIILLSIGFSSSLAAKQNKYDSTCIQYSFQKGDTLIYTVLSRDSIVLNSRPTIVRDRIQTLQISCDSVSNGLFYLQQRLLSIKTKDIDERGNTGDERNSHPWQKRTAHIVINKYGHRIHSYLNDTLNAGIAPGGTFQTSLLLPISDTVCRSVASKASWDYLTTDTLAENGFPYPKQRHYFAWSARHTVIDTLKTSCAYLEYGLTGQASSLLSTNVHGVYQQSVAAATGIVYHSLPLGIPMYAILRNNHKLTIKQPKLTDIGGQTYEKSSYILKSLRRGGALVWGNM